MRTLLIRLSVLAYPRRWRARYGDELQRLTLTVMTAQGSTLASQVRILGGLLGHGLAARTRTEPAGNRTLAVTVTTLAATIAISTSVVSDGAFGRPGPTLSPDVRLGTGVSVVYSDQLTAADRDHRGILVRVSPTPSGQVLSVTGGPARVVMDLDSGQILSISRRRG